MSREKGRKVAAPKAVTLWVYKDGESFVLPEDAGDGRALKGWRRIRYYPRVPKNRGTAAALRVAVRALRRIATEPLTHSGWQDNRQIAGLALARIRALTGQAAKGRR